MNGKKVLRRIHMILSIPFGIFITIICLTGAVMVFENEITKLVDPQFYAQNIDNRHAHLPFFKTVLELHRWLLGSSNVDGGIAWGKEIVGLATVAMIIIIITGVWMWAINGRKLFVINIRKGWKRFLYDLHVVGGLYACLFLLLMAITGLTWSYPKYRSAFYGAFGVEVLARGGGKPAVSSAEIQTNDAKPIDSEMRSYERGAKPNVTEGGSKFEKNNQSKAKEYKKEGEQSPNDQKFMSMKKSIFELHVGKWGGIVTRILSLLATIIGATLPITGYHLLINRVKRKNRKS
jgi:uncharacterized iron-regulated membrane protein